MHLQECKVDFKIMEDEGTPAFVELTFMDKEVSKVSMADQGVVDLIKMIELKGGAMELNAVMKEVGFDPKKLADALQPK